MGLPVGKLVCASNDNNVLTEFFETGSYFTNREFYKTISPSMDIIISSDNCVLNLAGAMGKRTIGLFNYDYEFRWYDLNEKNCGYFKSVKPFVNDITENWDINMDKAIEIIKEIKKESK